MKKRLVLSFLAIVTTILAPAVSFAQSVVIINQMGNYPGSNNPNMLCLNAGATTVSGAYNVMPGKLGWLSNTIGKIQYNVNLNEANASCTNLSGFYIGIGNDDKGNWGYEYASALPPGVTLTRGDTSTAPCNVGADVCFIAQANLAPPGPSPIVTVPQPQSYQNIPYRGVNLSGAEFDSNAQFPQGTDVPYFVKKGMTVVRLPIKWEALQPVGGNNLDTNYLNQIHQFINFATGHNVYVILDLHNYMRYPVKGSDGPVATSAQLSSVWGMLSKEFANNPLVIFEVMNEPHDMPTEDILANENAAIQAIRNNGSKNLILISGNGWDGMSGWTQNYYGTPNSQVFTKDSIKDPLNNFAIDVHEYFDDPNGGGGGGDKNTQCVDSKRVVDIEQAQAFVDWLHANNFKAFLTELGANQQASCYNDVDTFLSFLEQNKDVFIGWTGWAGGSAWPSDYVLSLAPLPGDQDRPQMQYGFAKHVTPLNNKKA